MLIRTLIFISLIGLSLCSQSIPIPSRKDGVKIGRNGSSFVLEAHYDLLCPGSQEAFFTLMKVIQDHDLLSQEFQFVIHLFPLPYHTYSFKLSTLGRFFMDNYGDIAALHYITFVFHNQDSFSNENLSNLTEPEINSLISREVVEEWNGTISESEVLSALRNGTYNSEARVSWKLGCQRNVAGTPTHFINGIRVDDSWEFGYEEWANLLKEFVPMKRKVIITLRNPN